MTFGQMLKMGFTQWIVVGVGRRCSQNLRQKNSNIYVDDEGMCRMQREGRKDAYLICRRCICQSRKCGCNPRLGKGAYIQT